MELWRVGHRWWTLDLPYCELPVNILKSNHVQFTTRALRRGIFIEYFNTTGTFWSIFKARVLKRLSHPEANKKQPPCWLIIVSPWRCGQRPSWNRLGKRAWSCCCCHNQYWAWDTVPWSDDELCCQYPLVCASSTAKIRQSVRHRSFLYTSSLT